MTNTRFLILSLGTCVGACSPLGAADEDDDHEATEVITTVTLTFTPEGGSAAVVAAFRDPDGNGGMSGTTDPIVLAPATTYTLTIEFDDELQSPAEPITPEVQEEAEEHQIFMYGSAVFGPAMYEARSTLIEHAYDDRESDYGPNTGDDLPVGLRSTVTTRTGGEGELVVMLRHLPELNGAPQKVPDLATDLADGEALPGDVDAMVTFMLTVE